MGLTALILSGGKSSRMGKDKSKLMAGGMTFLERISANMAGADELIISVSSGADGKTEETAAKYGARIISDSYADAGPLAGIDKAMTVAKNDRIFVVTCDMPDIDIGFAMRLYEEAAESDMAVVPVDSRGTIHPLAAIYDASLEPMVRRLLDSGERRVSALINMTEARLVRITEPGYERRLININDPGDYDAYLKSAAPVFGVSGVSDTGKTTMLAELTSSLASLGIKAAYIKHAHHEIELPEGKDSSKLFDAGAVVSTVISDDVVLTARRAKASLDEEVRQIRDMRIADVILVEGWKENGHERIDISRGIDDACRVISDRIRRETE